MTGICQWRLCGGVQLFLPRPAPVFRVARCDPFLPHLCSHLVQVNHLNTSTDEYKRGQKKSKTDKNKRYTRQTVHAAAWSRRCRFHCIFTVCFAFTHPLRQQLLPRQEAWRVDAGVVVSVLQGRADGGKLKHATLRSRCITISEARSWTVWIWNSRSRLGGSKIQGRGIRAFRLLLLLSLLLLLLSFFSDPVRNE